MTEENCLGEWSWLESKNLPDSHKNLGSHSIHFARQGFGNKNTTLQPTFPHHGLKVEEKQPFLAKSTEWPSIDFEHILCKFSRILTRRP